MLAYVPKKRGAPIDVHTEWLERCKAYKEAQGLTLAELARKLARLAPGAGVSIPVLSRYLRGEVTTWEVTEAFAELMGVASPRPVMASEKEAEWCYLGRKLLKAEPELFEIQLSQARALVQRYTR